MVRPKTYRVAAANGLEEASGASAARSSRKLTRELYGLESLFSPARRLAQLLSAIGVKLDQM
jgi:hypothetical protein